MTTKSEFQQKVSEQLTEWEKSIEELKERAADAAGDAKAALEKQMEELGCKCDEARGKLDELKDMADDTWEKVKDEAEEALSAMKGSFEEAVTKIKSFFS